MSLAEQIETLIAERALAVGERLPPERALAAELGVSRSRLREAIQQLISRGIVTSRQGGGTYVAEHASLRPLDAALKSVGTLIRTEAGYWRDVMEMRKSLDTDAAYYAAQRATEADKTRLKAALGAVSKTDSADPAVQARADAAFHIVIAEASHNAVLRQVVIGLSGLLQGSIAESLSQLYRLPMTTDALNRQHGLIIDAILAGDAERARKAAADHLVFVEESLRAVEEASDRQRRSSFAVDKTIL